MGIHNSSCIFLERKPQAFIEVLATGGIRLDGAWDDGVGGLIVDAFPF